MAKKKTLAIPLRCLDYSNTSQVVSLFSREVGLLDGIAKGAHRERNPFEGPFDLAVLYEVVFVERRSHTGLSILTEARVLDGFRGIRRRWERHAAAALVIEILRPVLTSGEAHRDLFDLAIEALSDLDSCAEGSASVVLLRFEIEALRLLGFLASTEACGACGRPWPRGRSAFFSAEAGGLVCRGCRERLRLRRVGDPLVGEAVEVLRQITEREAPRLRPGVATRQLHRAVLDGCILLLERPLRMIEYAPL